MEAVKGKELLVLAFLPRQTGTLLNLLQPYGKMQLNTYVPRDLRKNRSLYVLVVVLPDGVLKPVLVRAV